MTQTAKVSTVLIAIGALVVYLHRRLDFGSSTFVILGVFAFYMATTVLHINDGVKSRRSVGLVIFGIYSTALFYLSAIFFTLGQSTFSRISEIVAFLSLLLIGVLLWLRAKKRNPDADKAPSGLLIEAIPVFLGVSMLVVLNYR